MCQTIIKNASANLPVAKLLLPITVRFENFFDSVDCEMILVPSLCWFLKQELDFTKISYYVNPILFPFLAFRRSRRPTTSGTFAVCRKERLVSTDFLQKKNQGDNVDVPYLLCCA